VKRSANASIVALACGLALAAARPATAASTRIWLCDSSSDFSAGEARGVAVRIDGTLVLAEQARRVEGLSEASLFAAVPAKDGSLYAGTGDSGRIIRVSPDAKAEIWATVPEKEVTALAMGPDGAIYAGTSPGGRVYRVERGKPSLYYETKAQYVWALVFSGRDLWVGTGLPGEIHRVTSAGKGGRIHTTPDAHVRALYADGRGRIWAGTSGSGLVLRLDHGDTVSTVYDSAKTEVSSITGTADGRIWAAASSGEAAPAGNQPISIAAAPPTTHPPASASPREAEPGKEKPEVTVTVSTPRLAPQRPGSPKGAYSSEIVLLEEGEPARPVWTSSDEIVFSVAADDTRAGVLAATGPNGKLYRVRADQSSLERTFDEKQVTLLAGGAVGTNAATGLYLLSSGSRSGEYVSAVKDTGRTSRFGAYRWEGDNPPGTSVELSFRSGESSRPDSTWSAWSPWAGGSSGTIPAPAARFLQFRVRMESDGRHVPAVRRVEAAYRNRNTAPVIESLIALGPSEVFARSASGGSNVFETTAPDEKGIFTGLEESKSETPPRHLFRKGYRTLTWKASDADGDTLSYDLEFRPARSGRWLPLRRNVRETFYSFDTTSVPDGEYVFRVVASDAESNPDEKKTGSRETPPVVIDNTPPVIRKAQGSSGVFEFEALDELSPIQEAEYSVDAKEWVHLEPKDGLSDSPRERYAIRLDPKWKGGFLLVRVTDAARNTAAASFELP
jgi:sugar lactone lactonase YvrE